MRSAMGLWVPAAAAGGGSPTLIPTNLLNLAKQSFEDTDTLGLWYGSGGTYAWNTSEGYDGGKCGQVTWNDTGTRGFTFGGVDSTLENLPEEEHTFKIAVRLANKEAGGNGVITPRIVYWTTGYGAATNINGTPVDCSDGLWHVLEVTGLRGASDVHATVVGLCDSTISGDVWLFDRVFMGQDASGY